MAKPSSTEIEEGTVAMSQREAALDLAQTSYKVGKTDLRAVQQQQLSLQSAQLTLQRVHSEQLSQRTNLHLALGGSFAEPPVVDNDGDQALQSADGHGAILAAAR